MKTTLFLHWTILLVVIGSSVWLNTQLESIRSTIEAKSSIPKIVITDTSQFDKLCTQLSDQWGASGFAVYILQPKTANKTYKERSITSANLKSLPIRSELMHLDYQTKLQDNGYVVATASDMHQILPGSNKLLSPTTIIIAIQQNGAIVAEMYLTYEQYNLNRKLINSQISEAQILSQLLY